MRASIAYYNILYLHEVCRKTETSNILNRKRKLRFKIRKKNNVFKIEKKKEEKKNNIFKNQKVCFAKQC